MKFHSPEEIKAAAEIKLGCLLVSSTHGEFDMTLQGVTYIITVRDGILKYAIPQNSPDGLRPSIFLDKRKR
jgi:hypothetical protein